MEDSRPLFIEVGAHQMRRSESSASIANDFKVEIAAYPDDYVTDRLKLSFSGLVFRLSRKDRPSITGSFTGLISLKKPRLINVDREEYLKKTERMNAANAAENLNDRYFKALIALEGIFQRDLELKIFCRKNGAIEIRLRNNSGTLGKRVLEHIHADWLRLGSVEMKKAPIPLRRRPAK